MIFPRLFSSARIGGIEAVDEFPIVMPGMKIDRPRLVEILTAE
jgi:hypothetical protein